MARRSDDDYVLAIDLPRPGDDRSTHSSKSGGSLRTPLSQTTPHPHSTTTNTQCTSIAHPCSGKELSAEEIAQCDWIRATMLGYYTSLVGMSPVTFEWAQVAYIEAAAC